MDQVEVQPQKPVAQKPADTRELSFRDVVDIALVFGGVPALVLNVLFWAVAAAFAAAGALPTIMALLVTILLALTGIVLVVRYVEVAVATYRAADEGEGDAIFLAIGAGVLCVFLAVCMVGSLTTAGSLDGWHGALMGAEVLLVGYQTWRVFAGR